MHGVDNIREKKVGKQNKLAKTMIEDIKKPR